MPESKPSLSDLLERLRVLMSQGTIGGEVTSIIADIHLATAKEPRPELRDLAEAETFIAQAKCAILSRGNLAEALDGVRDALPLADTADRLLYARTVAILADLLRHTDRSSAARQIEYLRVIAAEQSMVGLAELVDGRLSLSNGKVREAHGHFTGAVEKLSSGPDSTTYGIALCHLIFTSAATAMLYDTEAAVVELARLLDAEVTHVIMRECYEALTSADQPGDDEEDIEQFVVYAHGMADAVEFFQILRL